MAVSLVSLLAMAALAIDVVTLYVARGEMQRAADAAALAGAKAFVDSGTSPASPGNAYATGRRRKPWPQPLINSILAQNKVSGAAPVLVGAPPLSTSRVPAIRRSRLPCKGPICRLFLPASGEPSLSTVSATAVAEAYNPGSAPANYPPIAPKCVKPLLVANQDPKTATTSHLVDPATGAPSPGVIGEMVAIRPCTGACLPVPGALQFRPAQVIASATNLCPRTCAPPASDYESSIDCCDSATIYQCGNSCPHPAL